MPMAATRFNLSHSRGCVACAVATGMTIGIDVETLSRKHGGLDIADRFFSPSEVAILHGTASNQQLQTFFRLWTLSGRSPALRSQALDKTASY
jgi:4'-phosphopantetheinyl transferase